jgi:hypothetical protein
MSESLEFIKKIGRHVTKAEEIKLGDIVGKVHSDCAIHLYCVKEVRLKWKPKNLVNCPEVDFKEPHIGLTIVKNRVFNHYIHTPMPGSVYEYCWMEMTKDQLSTDPLEIEWVGPLIFDLYLIEDENYKKLGNLINDVEVPLWGFMKQDHEEQALYDFVGKVKDKLIQARKLYEEIQIESKRF